MLRRVEQAMTRKLVAGVWFAVTGCYALPNSLTPAVDDTCPASYILNKDGLCRQCQIGSNNTGCADGTFCTPSSTGDASDYTSYSQLECSSQGTQFCYQDQVHGDTCRFKCTSNEDCVKGFVCAPMSRTPGGTQRECRSICDEPGSSLLVEGSCAIVPGVYWGVYLP